MRRQPKATPVPVREDLRVAEATVRSMRSNRSKDTKPELLFRQALRSAGLVGYRKHVSNLPGCPDVVFLCLHSPAVDAFPLRQ